MEKLQNEDQTSLFNNKSEFASATKDKDFSVKIVNTLNFQVFELQHKYEKFVKSCISNIKKNNTLQVFSPNNINMLNQSKSQSKSSFNQSILVNSKDS